MQALNSEALNDYLQWREVVFSVRQAQVDDGPGRPDRVYGVVMDVGLSDEFVISITTFASGESSLRTTAGGGAIGLGGDPVIAGHARQIVSLAQPLLERTQPVDYPNLPGPKAVYFYFLTPSGWRLGQSTLEALSSAGHPFGEMFARCSAIKARSEQLFQNARH